MNIKFVQGDWGMKTLARHEHVLKGGSLQIAHLAWVSQTCRKWIPDASMFAVAKGGQIGRRLGFTKVTIIPLISIKGKGRGIEGLISVFFGKSQGSNRIGIIHKICNVIFLRPEILDNSSTYLTGMFGCAQPGVAN